MASLRTVIAGILDELVAARAASDLESARIARLYAQDATLSGVAAPRMRFASIEIELPLLVEGVTEQGPEAIARRVESELKRWMMGRSGRVLDRGEIERRATGLANRGTRAGEVRGLVELQLGLIEGGAEREGESWHDLHDRLLAALDRSGDILVSAETELVRAACGDGAALRLKLRIAEEGIVLSNVAGTERLTLE